jgi:hypothetical protein
MACCSARRTTGLANGTGPSRPFLVDLLLLVLGVGAGAMGIAVVYALCPISPWARRQRVRFVAAVTDTWKASGNRLLDQPFLVGPAGRCRVSSALYGWSKPAAGFVFRYFNVLLLTALSMIVAAGGAIWTVLGDL